MTQSRAMPSRLPKHRSTVARRLGRVRKSSRAIRGRVSSSRRNESVRRFRESVRRFRKKKEEALAPRLRHEDRPRWHASRFSLLLEVQVQLLLDPVLRVRHVAADRRVEPGRDGGSHACVWTPGVSPCARRSNPRAILPRFAPKAPPRRLRPTDGVMRQGEGVKLANAASGLRGRPAGSGCGGLR